MRILMTADAAGGVGSLANELAGALRRRRHHVLRVVFSPSKPASSSDSGCLWAPFHLEWMDRDGAETTLADDVFAGRAFLADVARAFRPDVFHSNQFAYVGALPHVPTLLAVHSDVISWWRVVRGEPPPSNDYQRWYAATARRALAEAAAIVVPSKAARRDLLCSFAPSQPVRVIFNGCDPQAFPVSPKRRLALAAGRFWDEGKSLAVLHRLTSMDGFELAIAGDLTSPLHPAAASPPAGARMLGHLPQLELRHWMARAAVYIGTSVYEPFGLAVLEAALSGCMLVLRDIASWRELWGGTACFYSNPSQLQALLERAAADFTWACGRGLAACRHARRRFTAARMAQAYEAAYERLH